MEDDVSGESVVEDRPHLCKRLKANGARTEGVKEDIVDLCFK